MLMQIEWGVQNELAYHKEWSFASNHCIFLKILF